MALVTKPDFNLIFASQAPSQDTPPQFNNYVRGMDETRKNNGKPTIKQFNYLHQNLDLKLLWILQNGAALPYDSSIEYAENSLALKDGELQQFVGGVWSPFKKTVDASDVKDESGETQQQVNYNGGSKWHSRVGGYLANERVVLANGDIVKSTIAGNTTDPNADMTGWRFEGNTVESIADLLAIQNPKDGRTIHVSTINPPVFGTAYPFSGGGYYRFSTQSNKVSDGYIVIDTPTGKWLKQFEDITVDDFGALGNGIDDDSEAFNEFARSPYTGINIKLGENQRVYRISKQVDCKHKGLIGNGFSKQDEIYYKHSSIRVDGSNPSGFANENTAFNGCAFINVGAEIRDLQLKGDTSGEINGLQVSGYNTTISNINLSGFKYQVFCNGGSVSFRVSDLMSVSAGEAGFYFRDATNTQSTTAYFERCSWQWGKAPVVFEKEAFGCSFRDIIIEYMDTGLTAKVWSNCIFDNIWAEETRSGQSADWLVNTQYQQSVNNQYSNLYIRTPWNNRCAPNANASADNTGGTVIEDSKIALNGSTGAKILFSTKGIETRFSDWYGGSARKLRITTQPNTTDSNYKTPLHIDAPNNELYFGNESETSSTPVVFKRVIGADATGTKYYAPDVYTKTMRNFGTYNHGSNSSGQFVVPMFLTYDQSFTTQQDNAGWTIVKETTGVYRVERKSGNTGVLSNPNIVVGAPIMGTRIGNGALAFPSLYMLETYSGSWTVYAEASGFKVFWKDITGTAVDPWRFTVSFTLSSGF